MAQGWEELRLITDGRWQPTGQLRDTFPWATPPVRAQGEAPATFHAIDVRDTFDAERHAFIAGAVPERGEPIGALGWARFSRP